MGSNQMGIVNILQGSVRSKKNANISNEGHRSAAVQKQLR